MRAWNALTGKEAANADQADSIESNTVERETQMLKWMHNLLQQE